VAPNLLSFKNTGTAVPSPARAVPTLWSEGLQKIFIFLIFLESYLDNYLQNKLKQRKTKQKQLNAWVASHEALF